MPCTDPGFTRSGAAAPQVDIQEVEQLKQRIEDSFEDQVGGAGHRVDPAFAPTLAQHWHNTDS